MAQIVSEKVLLPYGFKETGWQQYITEYLVSRDNEYHGDQGSESNLFVSARELALWGYLHLSKGNLKGKQILPQIVFEQLTSITSPTTLKPSSPRNGFFWWVQDIPRNISEIGNNLPEGSYQSLGITGCVCLVIPQHKTVAVRMLNQTTANPPDYNYLQDIQNFGNMVLDVVSREND